MVLGVGGHGGPEAGLDKRWGQCCAPPVLINQIVQTVAA